MVPAGIYKIRRYDKQLLEAARTVATVYDAAARFAVETILGWDVDISAFE